MLSYLKMKLQVDKSQRYAKMRAHTATHLLHAEIAKFFPNTKQAGSMVDDDLLRFDFVADRLLSPQEISDIEKKLNQIIYAAVDVVVNEMSIDEASKLWAKMFFEDKYGDTVRVVIVKSEKLTPQLMTGQETNNDKESDYISMEFCGWTHVTNTKDIWAFTILSQEAVASGVKRISAITWPKVIEKLQEKQMTVDWIMEKLWVKWENQIADRLDKILKESEEMKSTIESLETKTIRQLLEWNDFSSWKDLDKVFLVPSELNFKNIVFQAKSLFQNQNILIYTSEWWFVLLTKEWDSAKEFATRLGIKWWGNDNMVQGRDMKVLELFK